MTITWNNNPTIGIWAVLHLANKINHLLRMYDNMLYKLRHFRMFWIICMRCIFDVLFLYEIIIYNIIHEMNVLEIYIVVFLPAMSSIEFWLYKFYMRCNLLEGRSIITVFFLLVLSMHYLNFVSLNEHMNNSVTFWSRKRFCPENCTDAAVPIHDRRGARSCETQPRLPEGRPPRCP